MCREINYVMISYHSTNYPNVFILPSQALTTKAPWHQLDQEKRRRAIRDHPMSPVDIRPLKSQVCPTVTFMLLGAFSSPPTAHRSVIPCDQCKTDHHRPRPVLKLAALKDSLTSFFAERRSSLRLSLIPIRSVFSFSFSALALTSSWGGCS